MAEWLASPPRLEGSTDLKEEESVPGAATDLNERACRGRWPLSPPQLARRQSMLTTARCSACGVPIGSGSWVAPQRI
jgi:hypothetical protein